MLTGTTVPAPLRISVQSQLITRNAAVSAKMRSKLTSCDPSFNWDGFHAGVGITGGAFTTGPSPPNHASVDGIAGVNITAGQLLCGVEGQVSGYHDFTVGDAWLAKGEVRAGVLASSNVLLYGAVSGVHFSDGANYGGIGGGAEFAAMDNMSIDVEGTYYPLSNNSYNNATVSGSVLWRFNGSHVPGRHDDGLAFGRGRLSLNGDGVAPDLR